LISATQLRENEEAAVTGLPRFIGLFLLHGRSNLWMTMEEVRTQSLKGKC